MSAGVVKAISAVSSGSTKTLPLSLQYRDRSGNLQRYDSEIERELLRCMESDSQRFVLVPNGKGAYYFFDLGKMEQRLVSRVINGKPTFSSKAVVKVIAMVPGDGAMMASIAAKAEKNLRRKVSPLLYPLALNFWPLYMSSSLSNSGQSIVGIVWNDAVEASRLELLNLS